MCDCTHRNPIHCILPPYILRKMARDVTGKAADKALRTLAIDTTFRSIRATSPPPRSLRGASISAAPDAKVNRSIYTAKSSQNLPGDLIRAEGGPAISGDLAANEAYDGLGATFNFYHDVFERNSIDDEGLPLIATVHFGKDYDNAFWNGQQMVFGDGDGELFQRFTISVDVIGHELTHGVTSDESKLDYNGQSGALNESMSDVFGIMIKQYLKHQTADQSDWLIGEGLLMPSVKGVALRSMKEPGTAFDDPQLGKDPQPGNMKDYVQTMEDNGGVHINSGIPNKAFYLAAIKIGGNAWEKAGAIWYATQRDKGMRPNITFARFAGLTLANAQRLYGAKGKETEAVREAWNEVGVKVGGKVKVANA
jgi:Zn-dependent metalloprotease